MQKKIKLVMRGENVHLVVEPKAGDCVRVVSGTSENGVIDSTRLGIFEQFYQPAIKKAMEEGAARAGYNFE